MNFKRVLAKRWQVTWGNYYNFVDAIVFFLMRNHRNRHSYAKNGQFHQEGEVKVFQVLLTVCLCWVEDVLGLVCVEWEDRKEPVRLWSRFYNKKLWQFLKKKTSEMNHYCRSRQIIEMLLKRIWARYCPHAKIAFRRRVSDFLNNIANVSLRFSQIRIRLHLFHRELCGHYPTRKEKSRLYMYLSPLYFSYMYQARVVLLSLSLGHHSLGNTRGHTS